MQRKRRKTEGFLRRTSLAIDPVVGVLSPRWMLRRAQCRAAWDILDGGRTRRRKSGVSGTGDSNLSMSDLGDLREMARDMSRNNPLAKGLLKTERNGVVGSGCIMQGRTSDDNYNDRAEKLWKEYMVQIPCDVTGRFNINKILREMYLGYRRDGDNGAILLADSLQVIEGDQVGTPFGRKETPELDVINGVAFSKKTKKLIGYYIGTPNRWGYINPESVRMYKAGEFCHMFDADRVSYSRGVPVLTASMDLIDKLCSYIDAEVIAAKVQACFSVFIAKKNDYGDGLPDPSTEGSEPTGYDSTTGKRLEKVDAGTIFYGEVGEEATPLGMNRPGGMFDPFVNRLLSMIGRPLLMPLMLVTLDFSGATFMNARIAYDQAHDGWKDEQEMVVKVFMSRVWRWFIDRMIAKGKLKDIADKYAHDVVCKRWPYVDPFKESRGDETQLKNTATNMNIICARQGLEAKDVADQRGKEIVSAIERAEKIKKDTGVDVPWQHFAGIPVPKGALPAAKEPKAKGKEKDNE